MGTRWYAQTEIERMGRKVGEEPTIDGIGHYLSKSVKPGMPRSQVEQAIQRLGPLRVQPGALDDTGHLRWGPVACDHIFLRLSLLPGHEWEMVACYNSQGGLVRFRSADPEAFPALDISAP